MLTKTNQINPKLRLLCVILLVFCLRLEAMPGYHEPWGKDSNIALPVKKANPPKLSLMGNVAKKIILFHQNVISPVDGPRSNFRPTSSRYMLLAIQKYGFFKGYVMGCDRLLRENDSEWVYRTIIIDDKSYKFDPVK